MVQLNSPRHNLPTYLCPSSSDDGPVSRFFSRIAALVGYMFMAVIIGGLAIGCLLILLGVGVWLVVDVLVPTLPGLEQTFHQVVACFSGFGTAAWQEVAASAGIGLGLGMVIGFLRYRLRVRSRRVEEILSAVASPKVLSAAQIGISSAAIHAAAGVASGAVLAWLGLPLRALLTGQTATITGDPTPVVTWLLSAGLLGGPEAIVPLGLTLLALIVLAIVCGAIAMLGLAIVARAMASGVAGTVGRSFGIALTVAITELWRQYILLSPRPPPPLEPITLDQSIQRFVRTHRLIGDPELAHQEIGQYLDWLTEQGEELSFETVAVAVYDYNDWMREQGRERPGDVLHMGTYLSDEIMERNQPVSPSATDDDAWMREIAADLFQKGWLARTLATGAVAGAMTGVLEALIVGVAVYALS